MHVTLKKIWDARRAIIIITTPIVLLPLPILYTSTAGRCAYGLLIMAVYWMTEAIPIAATALIPIALFPLLGVASSRVLCPNYFKDTNVLFVGGLMVAVAVEKWNLHKRLALRVLLIVGSRPKWLMFGFMITTAFLSMWISNTATTAMMVPIAQAVLDELDKHRKTSQQLADDECDDANANDLELVSSKEPLKRGTSLSVYNRTLSDGEVDPGVQVVSQPRLIPTSDDESFKRMCKGLTLCICYAANIGGTATLTGTGPNLVLKGIVDTLYDGESGITFSSWFIFAFPNMCLCLLAAWLWLQLLFLGGKELFSCCFRKNRTDYTGANRVIRNEYEKLGPMSFAEKAVLGHFIVLALLWLTREPEVVPGWAYFFKDGYVTDASVSIVISLLLFMFPSTCPCIKRSKSEQTSNRLLDWQSVHQNLAWGIVLVLGGGFALADACKISGLSADISELFKNFEGITPWAIVLALCVIIATFTEVTSNVATTTIFLPILAELAYSAHVNPLYFMIAATVSASFAFMLPVATPPNAIVFAYGHLKISDMVKTGIMMNLICISLLQLAINTWGYAYFNFGEYPAWAGNITSDTESANMVTERILNLQNTTITA